MGRTPEGMEKRRKAQREAYRKRYASDAEFRHREILRRMGYEKRRRTARGDERPEE